MNEQPNKYWRANTRPITIAVLFLYLLEFVLIVIALLPAWTALVVILVGFPLRWLIYRVWDR
ncbi:hypothetical protein [Jatrophihabitans lederbergiae]|uniref:Uncharacterized protein n=1 Tax=Jatrophihabitans lederbergiae TaxID=3075547 RepID=A0ABU2JAK6_9ACTN|nr:hypothetical protein [Jatrophihabitans sp. DSM 44399]MDT0262015.1 hypothetical protein [Jatrophihabitans sp. DSM 44399]